MRQLNRKHQCKRDPKVKFSTIQDIKTHPDYDELKRVFGGEVPNDWLESYLKQQKKMFQSPLLQIENDPPP